MAEWTDATIAELRKLWDEGVSTAEIGRRIGMSKNAVIGKARRLLLPERANPVGLTREQRMQLGMVVLDNPRPRAPMKPKPVAVVVPLPERAWLNEPVILRAAVAPPLPAPVFQGRRCEWLEGEWPPYARCDGKATHGSWCERHAAKVFVKSRYAA